MSDPQPAEMSDSYSIDFDVTSPSGIQWVRGLLAQLSDNDGVFRVAIEIESSEPLDPADIFLNTQSLDEGTPQTAAVSQTTTPQPETEGAEEEVEETSVPEDGADEADEEGVECEHCGEPFDDERALSGHLRWCDERPDDDEQTEPDRTIEADYDLSVGTAPYKVASTLAHIDDRPTPQDMETLLDGTDWELDRGRLSTLLGDLYRDAIVEREQRASDAPGKNPYQYWLNEEGQDVIARAEEQAADVGVETYEDIAPSAGSDTDEDQTDDTEDAADTEADGADETDEDDEEFECEICGEPFETKQGLGSHRYHKHSDDSDEENAEAENLHPGTQRYHIASALTLTNESVVPRELEELLAGTNWEHDRSNISGVLGELHNEGVVEREQREDEPGQPFEYILTEDGRDHVNEAILAADENDAETINDVMQSMVNDGEEGESEAAPSGLDALFNEEEATADSESGLNHFEGQETAAPSAGDGADDASPDQS